jgi:hypothetical protein
MEQNGCGMLHVNLKNKKFPPGLECMIVQTEMGILIHNTNSRRRCSAPRGTGMKIILMMIFHLAGCGRIDSLVSSPYCNAEPETAAQGDKTTCDYADPDEMMNECRIISYKIQYYLVHRLAPLHLTANNILIRLS